MIHAACVADGAGEGHTDSETIRLALREAVELRRRKSAVRLEAEAAAKDPADLAEACRVRAEIDAIAAAAERLKRASRRSLTASRSAQGVGEEHRGSRFAVVVQANELLALSTALVSPTSASAPARSFRPTIEIRGAPTRVLVEETTAASIERLGGSVGRLSASELRDLDAALVLVFGL